MDTLLTTDNDAVRSYADPHDTRSQVAYLTSDVLEAINQREGLRSPITALAASMHDALSELLTKEGERCLCRIFQSDTQHLCAERFAYMRRYRRDCLAVALKNKHKKHAGVLHDPKQRVCVATTYGPDYLPVRQLEHWKNTGGMKQLGYAILERYGSSPTGSQRLCSEPFPWTWQDAFQELEDATESAGPSDDHATLAVPDEKEPWLSASAAERYRRRDRG